MSDYRIDEYGRRIDIRPDLAGALEPRYGLRPCGQYHGTRVCPPCKDGQVNAVAKDLAYLALVLLVLAALGAVACWAVMEGA